MLPSMTPLAGGSGETFLAEAADGRSVVRVYGERSRWRGPTAPLVDAAVLRLVRGLLPAPQVLEVRAPVGGAPGLLVTSELPGAPGEDVLPALDPDALGRAGEQLGGAAARLAGVPVLRRGVFADGDLRLVDFPPGAAPGECLAAVEQAYAAGAFDGWPAPRLRGLGAVAARAQRIVEDGEDELGEAAFLSHGDLGPANVLLDPATGDLLGVVDWEFAHAGIPWTDLGNLLRGRGGPDDDPFAAGVLGGWREATRLVDPPGATRLLDLARAADLLALTRLAGGAGHAGAEEARARLAAIADRRDLHARLGDDAELD